MNDDLATAVDRLGRVLALKLVDEKDMPEKIRILHQAGFSNGEIEAMTGAARGTVSGTISKLKKKK